PRKAAENAVSPSTGTAELLAISARGAAALKAAAERWRAYIEASDAPLGAICYGASRRRAAFTHRLAVVGGSKDEIAAKLDAFLAGEARTGLDAGVVPAEGEARRAVFVFGGQGAQWWGMARELLASNGTFRTVMRACDKKMRAFADWSLLAELAKGE